MDQLLQNPYIAVLIFTVAGIILELLQVSAFFLISRLRLVDELTHENQDVGWIVAGLLISMGLIIHSAMSHNPDLVRTVLFSLFGAAMNILAYYALDVSFRLLIKGWKGLDHAIQHRFLPGAIMSFGAFIAVGLIIAGALA